MENIHFAPFIAIVAAVHPHMRGEYAFLDCHLLAISGSSPHAWRICDARRLDAGISRFIPTCVENMLASTNWIEFSTVHPHMRGEYKICNERRMAVIGSSPHAWRISNRSDGLQQATRFIPTCVENICQVVSLLPALPVHPHMRGEYLLPVMQFLAQLGSSPHAWRICSHFIFSC